VRSFLTGLAVVLTATTAFAATAHVTLTVNGSSSYDPSPGETFRVDVHVWSDVPMSAWGIEPLDEADAGYAVAATVLGGYYANLGLNYADDGPPAPIENSQGWDIIAAGANAAAETWPAGLINDLNGGANNDFRPGTVAKTAAGAVSGFAVYFDLTAPLTEDLVTRIILEDAYAGDVNFQDLDVTYEPLMLSVPEPSALSLLMLGAWGTTRRRHRQSTSQYRLAVRY
jgi:hypothetical protein